MSDTTDSWEPLSANLVHQAVVCPIQKSRMESHVQHLGVFDERGDLIESSIEDRHHGTHLYQAADLSIYSEIDTAPEDEAIYAGVFFNHFGHFLLESLARLWYARSRPDLPIVWVGVDSWAAPPALKSWQREILDVLGLKNRVRVATRAERFRVLHVPDAGYKYADWCHPDHAAFLASFDGVRQIAGRRIWLSRSDVGNGVGTMNGSMIEENVRKSGWHPIRPEKLTVREQLQTLAEAEEIAGEEGSAFHLLLLLKDLDGKKFHIFRRYGFEHMSFHTIGNARGVEQYFYSTDADAVLSIAGREVQRLAPNARQVLDSLRAPLHPSTIKNVDGYHSVRRLNSIIAGTGARTYLEIGLGDGSIFRAINCEKKIGIDSPLKFDVRRFPDSTSDFYSLDPHDFVTHFSNGASVDVVFLNNCHDFGLVTRFVTSVLPLTHPKSVIVIDNAVPSDEFSAMTDPSLALRSRQEAGLAGKAWHGDVFKAVLALKSLLSSWQLITIGTGGNPQAVFVGPGRSRKYTKVEHGSLGFATALADIANLTFHELESRRIEMNIQDEKSALEHISNA